MKECTSCKQQNSKTQGLCLEKECKNNRRFCGSCYLRYHQMHKNILLNENEKVLEKCMINSKNQNKEQYLSELSNIVSVYEESFDNMRATVDSYITKWKNELSFVIQIYVDSFDQQYEENILKMIRFSDQGENQKIQTFVTKLEFMDKLNLYDVEKFIETEKLHAQKIKMISKNSQGKLKEYFDNLGRQILNRRERKKLNKTPWELSQEVHQKNIQAKQLSDIEAKLQKMNNFNLKKLTILCDTRPHCLTNRSLEIVTSMKNLSYLSLLWTKKLKSDQIVDVIKNCPHLQYLALPGSTFDKECASELINMNSKISQIHLFSDFHQNMNIFTSSLYYMGSSKVQRKESLDIQTCLEMAVNLTNLKTMWIGSCENEKITQIFKQMGNRVQDLILGQFDGIPRSLPNSAIEQLNKISNINSLMLIIINNDETDFEQFFTINKNLNVLLLSLNLQYLVDCQGIRDGSLINISENSPFLSKLGLQYCEEIIGNGLTNFCKIKELYLVECQQVSSQYFIEFLQNNNQLEILSVKGNEWVDDSILVHIGRLFNLKYLNVGCTNIKSGLLEIKHLSKLRSLNVGGSKISVISLKTIANQLIGIEKINVGGMNGDGKKTKIEDEDLSALLKSLINLTHLAIYKCTQLTDKSIKYISPTIKCIWLQGTRISENKMIELKNKGIYVIDQ